jgi:ferredoxin
MFKRAPIRLLISLLLSITLGTQAFAVSSFKSCHERLRLMAALSVSHETDNSTDQHHHGNFVAAKHQSAVTNQTRGDAHQAALKAPAKQVTDKDRTTCAACAGCAHAVALVYRVSDEIAPIAAASTTFLPTDLARARNVASGLERPPRA